MTPSSNHERGGVLGSAKGSIATVLSIVRTRLELLGNEIKEEKLRVVRMLLLALVAAFGLLIGALLAIAWLLALYWEHRVVVLGSFTALFFLIGGLAGQAVRRAMNRPDNLFSSSMAELQEDLHQIKGSQS
ncbi:MAG TPA: phage holin family protein [Accumulibacter sp.]|jgi:uncharacterized membrane protein YqjE|nr:phage holin family protein [Accumulibacter sp.]HQC79131.1 phage holin family protein [Accumulibacter sp.]